MSIASIHTVEDYMTHDPAIVRPDAEIHEAIDLLARHAVCAVIVVDPRNRLLGILSEKDCLDAFLGAEYYESPPARVGELMCSSVVSVSPETDIFHVAQIFSEKRFHHIPVIRNGRLVGQIGRKEVIRAIQKMRHGG